MSEVVKQRIKDLEWQLIYHEKKVEESKELLKVLRDSIDKKGGKQ